ncbi:Uu.00g096960.m01.CDS01 [Anthostomella pinea]|uniref:Uu.00g096960.m01.CDS01 n=1 Tax=Anthostomella pinea TaxID=933095 RepID=A0AAI8VD10_9PEZI|nr:Uu.00g096960.m01.CDS01 [Anthostomella pinea]
MLSQNPRIMEARGETYHNDTQQQQQQHYYPYRHQFRPHRVPRDSQQHFMTVMNGNAAERSMLSQESEKEKMAYLGERQPSDIESESGRSRDSDDRFSETTAWSSTTANPFSKSLRIPSWSRMLRRTAVFLLPSFLHHHQHRLPFLGGEPARLGDGGITTITTEKDKDVSWNRNASTTPKQHPTAYLDGMRGLAALFVVFCHYAYTSFVIATGWGVDGANRELLRLPFVRLLYSGPSMVCVFFVVSGYALSLEPLKQARARSYDGLLRTLSSFAFRRAFRLFLPPMATTLAVVVLLRLGALEGVRGFVDDPVYFRNVRETHPPLLPSGREQFRHWAWQMFDFVHVFGWEQFGGSTGYDVHLWTIPLEFRCSLFLFLTQLATARQRAPPRMVCLVLLSWFSFRLGHWEVLLFLAGMAIAELDLIRGAHEPSRSPSRPTSPTFLLPLDEAKASAALKRACSSDLVWTLVSVPALYLMSCPDAGPDGDVPGWRYLASLIPDWFAERYRFWQIWGAVLFVFCAARSPGWQRVFTTPLVQYFGRISYAVYLLHGPVLHTVGYRVERWAWGVTGTEDGAYERGFVLAGLVNIPLIVWVADVFWRAVDAPVVRFAKWLEAKLVVED